MTTRVKWLLLIGLALIWLTLLAFEAMEEPIVQRVPLKYKSGQTAQSADPDGAPLLALSKHRKKDDTSITFTTPRNIFAPLGEPGAPKISPSAVHKPKTSPPPTPSPGTKRADSPRTVPAGPSAEELAAQQARQQLNQYRYLGYLQKEGQSQVFLSNGQAIYIAQQGETLEGDIHILSIEPTSVVLSKRIGASGRTVTATLQLVKEGSGA